MKEKAKRAGRLWLIGLGFVLFLAPAQAQTASSLTKWLADDASFWERSPSGLEQEFRAHGFRWVEKNVQSRANPLRGSVLNTGVAEALVQFSDGSPKALRFIFFNRGDMAPISEKEFNATVEQLQAAMKKEMGRVPGLPGRHRNRSNQVKESSMVWQTKSLRHELAWSYSTKSGASSNNFRGEYIRLTVVKSKPGQHAAIANKRVNPFQLRGNVKRDGKTGAVELANVPMVDQGKKGYCAAATSERVLRY